MNTISQFATDDPKQLGTQLSKLEQNVVKETASIRQAFELSAVPIDDDRASPIKTYTVGQCARLDTRAGIVTLHIAAPADGLPGELIVVQKQGTNGYVAIGINARVNGTTAFTSGPEKVDRFYFDGTDFWT